VPTRLLRDGILESEAVCSLPWAAEVLYRRLMSVADDYGRFSASPKLIRAKCYPLQIDKVSDSDVGKWLAQVAEAGLVRVYPAQDGKRYLEIVKFGQQVRSKSKHPAPPDGECAHCEASDSSCLQSPANAHLDVFGDEDESVDEAPPPPADAGGAFDRFWKAWPTHPRKVARKQCEDKWRSRGCDAIAERVMASLEDWKRSDAWRKGGGEFIPAPLVWLNQSRWEAPSVQQVQAELVPWHSTRKGIEDMGERLGLGRWDSREFDLGRGEMFSAYERRVKAAAAERGVAA